MNVVWPCLGQRWRVPSSAPLLAQHSQNVYIVQYPLTNDDYIWALMTFGDTPVFLPACVHTDIPAW